MLTHDKEWILYEIVEGLFVASYIKVVENIWQLQEIPIFKKKAKQILNHTAYIHKFFAKPCFNPLTSARDQDRIPPYYICTISRRHVMRIKKKSITGLLIDAIPNSSN